MRKIQLNDIKDIAAYERMRSSYRPKIMAEKDKRRIHVGPKVTYLFETYDTMLYQVQEMMRAERIVEDEGILGEIEAYNELIPDHNQLSASMLIEIDDINERKGFLSKIITLPKHCYLSINGIKVRGEFDPRQGSEDKLSSVQYVKFSLTPEQAKTFDASSSKVIFGFDHPLYSHEYQLNENQKATLAGDLKAK